MNTEFDMRLLRLKAHVGIKSDKHLAELLGMTDKALHARKRRDVFPDDKLYALALKRPDLRIDPGYILTGELWPRASDVMPTTATKSTPPTPALRCRCTITSDAPTSAAPDPLAHVASTINWIAVTLTRLRLDLQAFDGEHQSTDDLVERLRLVTDDVWRLAVMLDDGKVAP